MTVTVDGMRRQINSCIVSVERINDCILTDQLNEDTIGTVLSFPQLFKNNYPIDYDQRTLDSYIFHRVERLASGYKNRCLQEIEKFENSNEPTKAEMLKKDAQQVLSNIHTALKGLLDALNYLANKNEITRLLVNEIVIKILANQKNTSTKSKFVESNLMKFESLADLKEDAPTKKLLNYFQEEVLKVIKKPVLSGKTEDEVYQELNEKWVKYIRFCEEFNQKPDPDIFDQFIFSMKKRIQDQ